MGNLALAYDDYVAPRIIKISSKRQITIPAEMYEKSGFYEYAYIVWNDDGSLGITPIDVKNEESSVKILRSLLAQGLDGEDLINEYERIIHPVIDFKAEISKGMQDAEEGRVVPFSEVHDRMKEKHGL